MTSGETIALTRWTFVGKVLCLLFNVLSRLAIAFLPRSKRLLISWLQSPSAVILEPKKIKSATISTVSLSICHEVMGPDTMIFVFWTLSFQPAFSLSFTFIKRLFSSSWLSAIWVASLHIWDYWYFSKLSWFQLVLHPWLLLARILEWLAFPSPEDLPNPSLPHCRRILYQLSHHRSPKAVSVQFSPVAQLCLTLCDHTRIGRASTKNSAFLIWAVVIYLN